MSSEEYTATIENDGGLIAIVRKQLIEVSEFGATLREVPGFEDVSEDVARSYAVYLAREYPSFFDEYFTDPEFTQWYGETVTSNYDGFLDTTRPVFELLAESAGYDKGETARMFEVLKRCPIEEWATNLCDPTIPTGKHMLESSRWADYMNERLSDSAPGN